MSIKGGPAFTFRLPGGRLAPLPPPRQFRHWAYGIGNNREGAYVFLNLSSYPLF